MRIEKLSIQNFRVFKDMNLEFPKSNVAVFIGNNGKGKSTVLDAIAILLSQLVIRLQSVDKPQSASHRRYALRDEDIQRSANASKLEIRLNINASPVNWTVKKVRFEKSSGIAKKQNPELDECVDSLKSQLYNSPETEIPIAAYYATNRILLPATNYATDANRVFRFGQLAAYEGAFSKGLSDFGRFVAWFREEEDKENEWMRKERNFDLTNPRLQTIRQAFGLFFEHLQGGALSNLRVERDQIEKGAEGVLHEKKSALMVTKDGADFQIEQLSDGERVLMLMVCDIARRLAIANPDMPAERALEGEGIVLIDELDLHLHPQWQRSVLSSLRRTFPNIQFIVTTHSPQILSELNREEIFILAENRAFQAAVNPVGRDTNAILEEVMDTPKRPAQVEQLIQEYLNVVQSDSSGKAQSFREKLLKKLDSADPVFTKADALLTRKQLLRQ